MSSESTLRTRTFTAFLIVPVTLLFIFIETPVIIIPLYILIVGLMAKELYALTISLPVADSEFPETVGLADRCNYRLGYGLIIVGALITSLIATKQIDSLDEDRIVLIIMAIELLALSFISIFLDDQFHRSFRDQKIHLFLFFYLNFIFFHILKLKYFFVGSELQGLATFYLLFAFMISWFFDTSAYLFGRKWGKKKIGLMVSPQKSWAGLIAGLLSTLVAGLIVSRLLQSVYPDLWAKSFFSEPYFLWVICPVLGVVAQWGDLLASLHKRSSKVKDTGSLLKGHGGFYDRSDSVILVAMALYYFLGYYHG